jgi:hypothetical protein
MIIALGANANILLSINTDLRQGELFNLNWGLVDSTDESIIISGDISKIVTLLYSPK